ncbi:MAG: hypothetical protein MI923_04595 [Phycisphaerales bacterium]|nr:hypothetical protein [Phycisphaerales bacterium]
MIRWAAIVIASLSWVFAFHHFVVVDSIRQWASFFTLEKNAELTIDRLWQWTLILASVPLLAIGLRDRIGRVQMSGLYLIVLVPLAAALFVTMTADESAYRPPLIILTVGCIALILGSILRPLAFLEPAGLSATVLGVILTLQSPLHWLCTGWTARQHEVPYLGWIPYILLKWIGSDVSFSEHTLYIRLMRDTHAFPLTWEHFAILPLLAIWLAGAIMLWWDRDRRPFGAALSKFSLTLVFFSFLRLFVLLTVFITAMIFVEHESETVHVEVFWMPWITAVSFLPLIPFLARWVPWPADTPILPVRTGTGSHLGLRGLSMVLLFVACLGLVTHQHFWDPGVHKSGRVLLDEAHSQWERTDKPYDTDWYGHEAGYNYYCMAQYLRHYYQLDFNMDDKLTPEMLSRYDVLILKTPTEKYSEEELEAIENFVRQGGGLFALGEHTNVFGSSVFLNAVTRRFGMAFRYDSVFDIERKWEQVHFPSKLGRHPIMRDVDFFRFAVSCSIASNSWNIRPVIRSTGLWSLPISYAAGNFYPHVEDTAYAKFGAFNQMVSTTAGQGRVAAFSDSTVYSNFLAFYPGKPELLLSTVDWLNRTNRWSWINRLGLIVSVVALGLGLLIAWRLPPHFGASLITTTIGAALVWCSIWALSGWSRQTFSAPDPHTPVGRVTFEMQHSDYELPVFSFTKNYPKSYEVFYQYALRVGYYTDITMNLDRSLASSDNPIVLIRPNEPFSPETIEAAKRFVERGGSLLVLDSPANQESTANDLLQRFDLGFDENPCRGVSIVEPTSGSNICRLTYGLKTRGGTPLLQTEFDEPILTYARVGQGQVVAAGLAERFSDVQMGGSTRTVPDRQLRAAFEVEFELLRGLVEGDLEKHMHKLGRTYEPAAQSSTDPKVP